jgi:hypothetical protein
MVYQCQITCPISPAGSTGQEFSDEQTFSYCNSLSHIDVPAGRRPAGPNHAEYRYTCGYHACTGNYHNHAGACSGNYHNHAGAGAGNYRNHTGACAGNYRNHAGAHYATGSRAARRDDHNHAARRDDHYHDRQGRRNKEKEAGKKDDPTAGDR